MDLHFVVTCSPDANCKEFGKSTRLSDPTTFLVTVRSLIAAECPGREDKSRRLQIRADLFCFPPTPAASRQLAEKKEPRRLISYRSRRIGAPARRLWLANSVLFSWKRSDTCLGRGSVVKVEPIPQAHRATRKFIL